MQSRIHLADLSTHTQSTFITPAAALGTSVSSCQWENPDELLKAWLSWQPSSCNIQDSFYTASVIILAWDLMLTLYLKDDGLNLRLSSLWACSDSESSWADFTLTDRKLEKFLAKSLFLQILSHSLIQTSLKSWFASFPLCAGPDLWVL
jgi:hypothetical protein